MSDFIAVPIPAGFVRRVKVRLEALLMEACVQIQIMTPVDQPGEPTAEERDNAGMLLARVAATAVMNEMHKAGLWTPEGSK